MTGADQSPAAGHRTAGSTAARAGRSVAAAVVLVLTCILVPIGVVVVWVHDIALDTDRYVSTMAPLARNPAIQDAAVNRISQAVGVRVDGEEVASETAAWLAQRGLPPRAAAGISMLGPQLDSAVNQAVTTIAGRFVSSDAFANVWTGANRAAHASVVKVRTGEGTGAVSATDGTVTLDVGVAVERVKSALVDAGLSPAAAIPTVDKQMVLFQSDKLAKFRKSAHRLDVVGNWILPVVALLGVVGVLLAHRRRRALARTAWGSAAACLLVLIGLVLARRYYLDHLPAQVQSPAAAAAVFDTLSRFLRATLRMTVVLAVVVALGAYVTGPGRLPRGVRSTADRGSDAVMGWSASHGVHTGSAGRWTAAHRSRLTVAALVLLAVVFALWNHPTTWVVLLMVVLMLVALLVISLLTAGGRIPEAADVAPGPEPEGEHRPD